MIRLTWMTGLVLVGLGFAYFAATGWSHPTALIPSFFGIHLVAFGLLARAQNGKRLRLWSHISAMVGFLGFLFPGTRAAMAFAHTAHLSISQQSAAQEEIIMSFVCLVFTGLTVVHFIQSRKARLESAS